MKVYITSAYSAGSDYPDNIASLWLKEKAKSDSFKVHSIEDSPENADIILFMEAHPGNDLFFERVINHPLRRRHKEKTFLYHDQDFAFPLMPGIYPSITQCYYNSTLCRAGIYMARIAENHAIDYQPEAYTNKLLFSFIGANNCKTRGEILKLRYDQSHLEDTTGRHAWSLSLSEREDYECRYVEVCRKSEFILCPKGMGPSSYRLYEAMKMGKCPVIISDTWVPPPYIDWEKCSIRVAEKDCCHIPEILKTHSGVDSLERGVAARSFWQEFVSDSVCFHWTVESCIAIMQERSKVSLNERALYSKFVKSKYFPIYLKSKARNMRRQISRWQIKSGRSHEASLT